MFWHEKLLIFSGVLFLQSFQESTEEKLKKKKVGTKFVANIKFTEAANRAFANIVVNSIFVKNELLFSNKLGLSEYLCIENSWE